MRIRIAIITAFALLVLLVAVVMLVSPAALSPKLQQYYYTLFGEPAYEEPPRSEVADLGEPEPVCPEDLARPEWRKGQTIDGITIEPSPLCIPDNPYTVAAVVKGTNNVSMETLSRSGLALDAVVKDNDRDGDGDPDVIHVRLEVPELNGRSPDMPGPIPTYAIAPGIQPGFWVFAPKLHGMSTKSILDLEANPLIRVPSPTIRVEQGDTITVHLENTHYFPHTIHFHGVDHPYMIETHPGHGVDGVAETSELPTMPGGSHPYEMTPQHAGTMMYHCHVHHHVHFLMGLQGMFVVEENRPNNWVQTLNIGAGHVRHPSVAVRETYDREYDLVYQDVDKTLHELIKKANDPRLIGKAMHRDYDITDETNDYFLVNGRSFPYTVRESLIVVKVGENVKLRVMNGGDEGISLHSHGHKMTITDYDGVGHNPAAQITRDTIWFSSGQRLDLHLQAVIDGVHSYGQGVWMIHDHKETGVTSDGLYPGGNVNLIVYESYLDENGLPKLHGINPKFFNANYYDKSVPIWASYDREEMLGEVKMQSPQLGRLLPASFIIGLLAGGGAFLGYYFIKRYSKEVG